MQSRIAALSCACAALWLTSAAAQQDNKHPASPAAVEPSPEYASAFDGYRPFRDEKLLPWREVNDEAARVGGHIGIFRGGHAGHGSGSTVNDTAAPSATTQTQAPAHGATHQGSGK